MVPVPINEIADRLGNARVANMVMLGAILANGCVVSKEAVIAAMPTVVKSQPQMIELNMKAIAAGMETIAVS
jgi:2-oxoglutarate ferredoxin oxidoreductase subunit gamma